MCARTQQNMCSWTVRNMVEYGRKCRNKTELGGKMAEYVFWNIKTCVLEYSGTWQNMAEYDGTWQNMANMMEYGRTLWNMVEYLFQNMVKHGRTWRFMCSVTWQNICSKKLRSTLEHWRTWRNMCPGIWLNMGEHGRKFQNIAELGG